MNRCWQASFFLGWFNHESDKKKLTLRITLLCKENEENSRMKIKTQQLSKPVKTYADNGGDIPVGLNRFCKAKAAAGSQPVALLGSLLLVVTSTLHSRSNIHVY